MIPMLTTERLVLRGPELRDFEAYAGFRADPQLMRWLGGPDTRTAAWHQFCALHGQWVLRGHGRWIVTTRDDDAPVGLVGIFDPIDWPMPELSWAVFPGHEGKGYAAEASLAARRWWFDQGKRSLISHVAPGNARSVALALRLGCSPDGGMSNPFFGDLVRWHHPSRDGSDRRAGTSAPPGELPR